MERRKLAGFLRPPTLDQIREIGNWMYLDMSDEEAKTYQDIIAAALPVIDRVDDLPQPRFEIKYPRTPGYRPTEEEDPFNVFVTRCEIKGAPTGKLAGKKVAVKDNIAVAGVPMTNGNRSMTDVIPDFDAVVVERLLDAGATIVGKLNQDDFSFAGTSETSNFGAVRNPLNPDYSPGGSSSGEGAALRLGYADIALGVDQAGSARIPAAWTGTCCMKATHGLVPSFGIHYIDHTLDFVCPAAKTIERVALALEVIGGTDPRDPQWVRGPIKTDDYTKALKTDVSGLKIGIIKEAFGTSVAEEGVDEAALAVTRELKKAGAEVGEASVPIWLDSWNIWLALFAAPVSVMFESNEQGFFHDGYATPTLAQALGTKRRLWSNDLPPLYKAFLILGFYLRRDYDNVHFAKSQNLRHVLRAQMNEALDEYDVLVTPSTPNRPPKLMEERPTVDGWVERILGVANAYAVTTSPADITGHPALVMPCGIDDNNLPFSVQFIGKHWAENTLFRVGYTYEAMIQDLYKRFDAATDKVVKGL